jgi:serine/threonine protein kinase
MSGRLIAGRYKLDEPIGRGAMGVVWRARDELLDRDVAVKEVLISEALNDDERSNAYQRTLREARTAARLSHRGVVAIYDVAEEDGRPWIIMELVPAKSLDQIVTESGPLSPRRAGMVAQQLLAALASAHAAGVLHRDVKPSNVLLGSDGRAVLTDFGIATFQGDPRITQTGMVMGSPGYTAPERIRGGPATPASDLWSLGATLYTAVEGHGPFEKRGGAITTMSAITQEDPPPCPAAGPLGGIILALLRRDPVGRPDAQTAARLIASLLPVLPEERVPDTAMVPVPSGAAEAVGATMAAGPPVATTAVHNGGPQPDTARGPDAALRNPPTKPQDYPAPAPAAPMPAARWRRRWLITVAAIVVAACVGVGVALAVRSGTTTPSNAADTATVPTITEAENPALRALNHPDGLAPASYTLLSGSPPTATAGFSIGVAPGWNPQNLNSLVWVLHNPTQTGSLRIDLTPQTYSDPYREASSLKAHDLQTGGLPGYQQLALGRASIRGTSGAVWEFSWTDKTSGFRLRAEDLLFSKDGQSFALYLVADDAAWDKVLPTFMEELRTFSITTS